MCIYAQIHTHAKTFIQWLKSELLGMIYFQILFALSEYSCWLTLYFLTEFYNLFKIALPLIHYEYSLFVISDVLRVLSSSTK